MGSWTVSRWLMYPIGSCQHVGWVKIHHNASKRRTTAWWGLFCLIARLEEKIQVAPSLPRCHKVGTNARNNARLCSIRRQATGYFTHKQIMIIHQRWTQRDLSCLKARWNNKGCFTGSEIAASARKDGTNTKHGTLSLPEKQTEILTPSRWVFTFLVALAEYRTTGTLN